MLDGARAILHGGADKISMNTAAVQTPQLVADASAEDRPNQDRSARITGEIGWVAPEILDIDALARLRGEKAKA